MTFADCTTFEDRTAASAARVVAFNGFAYSPKCIRIKAGQAVEIPASTTHPLRAALQANNPIPAGPSTGAQTVTFPAAGLFGYWCANHGGVTGTGMAAAIDVVP